VVPTACFVVKVGRGSAIASASVARGPRFVVGAT
jgi:hypothetical protein